MEPPVVPRIDDVEVVEVIGEGLVRRQPVDMAQERSSYAVMPVLTRSGWLIAAGCVLAG
jgi:hypothetical protein